MEVLFRRATRAVLWVLDQEINYNDLVLFMGRFLHLFHVTESRHFAAFYSAECSADYLIIYSVDAYEHLVFSKQTKYKTKKQKVDRH